MCFFKKNINSNVGIMTEQVKTDKNTPEAAALS